MAVTQYIGARYVPLFADPVEWTDTRTYEPLTIVLHEGNSFTSRQFVPKGIDITNEDFWVETGNYNAQVELYRQDVARWGNRIGVLEGDLPIGEFSEDRTVKGYVDETAQELQGQIDATNAIIPSTEFTSEDTVKDYIDSSVASVAELLPSSAFTSESTVSDAIDATRDYVDSNLLTANALASASAKTELNYIGRIDRTAFDHQAAQGFCMIDNETGWFILTPQASEHTNECDCIHINLKTGEILDTVKRNFSHCNGMAYNKETGKVYVAPNCDYTNASAPINKLYVCDPSDLTIESEIALEFSPHSVTFDKVTGQMWITEEVSSPSYHINLYAFDYINATASFVKELSYLNLISNNQHVFVKNTTQYPYGYQNITAYNGVLYYLIGGGINAIVTLDTEGNFISLTNLNPKTFIYTYSEAQSIDFADNGVMFLWGYGKIITRDIFATISSVNAFGNTACCYELLTNAARQEMSSNVDGTKDVNYNIYQTGFTQTPFATFREALAFAIESKYNIVVNGTVEWKTNISDYPAEFGIVSIIGKSGAKLIIPNRFYVNCDLCILGNSSSNKLTLQLGTLDTPLTAYALQMYKNVFMRYVEFDCQYINTYPISNYGFFKSVSVSAINTENVPQDTSVTPNLPYIINANGTGLNGTTFHVYNTGSLV